MTVRAIGVTPGDPGGIGPEIVVKTLARAGALPRAAYVIFGDPRLLRAETERLGVRLTFRDWPAEDRVEPGLYLAAVAGPAWPAATGAVTPANGEASFRAFAAAVAEARAGRLAALATAPVSKAAWAQAGHTFRGHTEYLERYYPGAVMAFWSDRLKVALLTHHRPLSEAVGAVRQDSVLDLLRALHRGLGRVPGGPFRLLVAGLNPHAGEDGHLGREEASEVRPAIDRAAAEGIAVSGPFPPDTVFLQALDRPDTVVVALYHDQGLIPFKLLSFTAGVNVTLGLPFVRTSPDHGTAFDIAGKGLADPRSMEAAVRLAAAFSATGS